MSIDTILRPNVEESDENDSSRICTVDAESTIAHLLRIRRDVSKNVFGLDCYNDNDGSYNDGDEGGDIRSGTTSNSIGGNSVREDDNAFMDDHSNEHASNVSRRNDDDDSVNDINVLVANIQCWRTWRHSSVALGPPKLRSTIAENDGTKRTKRLRKEERRSVGVDSRNERVVVPPMEYCSVQMLYHDTADR